MSISKHSKTNEIIRMSISKHSKTNEIIRTTKKRKLFLVRSRIILASSQGAGLESDGKLFHCITFFLKTGYLLINGMMLVYL
jgi:hypothetical protein